MVFRYGRKRKSLRSYPIKRRVRRRVTRAPVRRRTWKKRTNYAGARGRTMLRGNPLRMGYAPAVANRMEILYSSRAKPLEQRLFKTLGSKHFIRQKGIATSCDSTGQNFMTYRWMPCFDRSTMYNWSVPSIGYAANNTDWVVTDFGDYYWSSASGITGVKKYYLAWSKITLKIKQGSEVGKVRVELVKIRKDVQQSQADIAASYNWDVDQPNTASEYWQTLFSKSYKFQPQSTDQMTDYRELTIFLPMRRICKTYNNIDVSV